VFFKLVDPNVNQLPNFQESYLDVCYCTNCIQSVNILVTQMIMKNGKAVQRSRRITCYIQRCKFL